MENVNISNSYILELYATDHGVDGKLIEDFLENEWGISCKQLTVVPLDLYDIQLISNTLNYYQNNKPDDINYAMFPLEDIYNTTYTIDVENNNGNEILCRLVDNKFEKIRLQDIELFNIILNSL